MFLKQLIIQNENTIIRDIPFHKGVNLIVDETLFENLQETGNNIGKTTVLRLVDYCLGGDGKDIYKDNEFDKQSNTKIEDFLKKNNILITLKLISSLNDYDEKEEIIIKRNFLSGKNKIQEINGEKISNKDFDMQLKRIVFKSEVEKPTFRQIISKNIRDDSNKMAKIVKVLNPYTTLSEYEALYLFWLGISTDNHKEKDKLSKDKTTEESFQKKLKKEGEMSLIEQKLILLSREIEELKRKKATFNLNKNYIFDIEELNKVKADLSKKASELSKLEMRKVLINESKEDLNKEYTSIDTTQIKTLYEKAGSLISNIQVSFEETVKFHNDLISEKLEYITRELPELEKKIKTINLDIIHLKNEEERLTSLIQKSKVSEDVEKIFADLNKRFEEKGKLEELKRLWKESDERLNKIERDLGLINNEISSKDAMIQNRIAKFNEYFLEISYKLYGERYLLSSTNGKDKDYELVITNREGNSSTGKKKGEIAAFDFAYIQFADDLEIQCLHFVLHDQFESIHENQQNTLFEVANSINGQYIVSTLRGKIPENIDISKFEILSLSQEEKLFKVS